MVLAERVPETPKVTPINPTKMPVNKNLRRLALFLMEVLLSAAVSGRHSL
jgi:hypothetical protein